MYENTLRDIVEQATRAPSIHNTQPWRFVSHDDTVEVWTDPSRGLLVLDPTGRSRHISCGAALLQARLAAGAAGYATAVTVLPDPAEPAHLADLVLRPGSPPDADRDLAAAIPARHTSREPFSDDPISAEIIVALRQAAEAEGAWLRVVTADDATAVAVLLSHADEVQAADHAYLEELRHWTHRQGAGDGIPATAVPTLDPAERGSDYRMRDFVADRDAATVDYRPPPAVERPLVAILGTDGDDLRAWITAGQALGRLLLTATAYDVQASPLTQAMEIPSTRARLTYDLGLLGHPQMLLRLGYGNQGLLTPRRPVDSVLTSVTT